MRLKRKEKAVVLLILFLIAAYRVIRFFLEWEEIQSFYSVGKGESVWIPILILPYIAMFAAIISVWSDGMVASITGAVGSLAGIFSFPLEVIIFVLSLSSMDLPYTGAMPLGTLFCTVCALARAAKK